MQEKLAVMDWGIGGMGFFRLWQSRFPEDEVIYFSDSGFTPYGLLDDDEMRARLTEVVTFLKQEYQVSKIMVACNAASTVVDEALEKRGVHGIVEPTVRWMRQEFDARDRLIVIGGNRIINGCVYSKCLPKLNIQEVHAQPLSALVELGVLDGEEVEDALKLVLGAVTDGSHIILACTHYVELLEPMQRLFPTLTFHDPVPFVLEELAQSADDFSAGKKKFLTTGETRNEEWRQVRL